MPIFNWNEQIKQIPDSWRLTEGENVKVALLDSGVDLSHPALSHLDVSGRKFNAAQAGFDPDADPLIGEDDVSDAVPFRRAHGTHCTSIIGARPVDNDGVNGVAPQADIYSIKIIDEDKECLLEYFIKGMKVAIRENVDVVVLSYFPLLRDPVDQEAIDEVFQLIEANHILVISTLENTSKLSRLNNLKFPSTNTLCLVNGVVRKKLLESFPEDGSFNENISYVFPELEVKYCTLFSTNKYLEGDMWSSYVTSAMAGVVTLLLAHWKNTEADYQRRSKAEVLAELEQITLPFDVQGMLDNPSFQFYNPRT